MKHWNRGRAGLAGLCALFVFAVLSYVPSAQSSVDAAFRNFWNAHDPSEAARAADAIVKANVSFDDAYARLKKGRTYASDVARGIVRGSHHFGKGDFGYTFEVPQAYDPARRYQVRIQLHGGVMGRTDGNIRGPGTIGSLAGVEQIYVMPMSWDEAPWWSDAQIENMRAVLDTLKRTYNVDENRIVLSGVSDGGTSTYYFAMRDTTPFASFLPLNGALAVLQNSSIDIDGQLFPQNMLDKPFFMVNGGKDPLYPSNLVEPYIEHMKRGGVEVLYHQQPDGVHNTTWWPQEKDSFETFVRDHPRKPYPDRLTWESDATPETSRAHWLVINSVTKERGKPLTPDLNDFHIDPLAQFGLKVEGTTVMRIGGGSSASTFFFEPGDVITAVRGEPIARDAVLPDVLGRFPEGRLTIRVSRKGAEQDLSGYFKPGSSEAVPLFFHHQPSGRVDLVREGNTVRATSSGAAEFTLLLSPDVFDFSKPVTVIADGKTVFNGRVTKTLATLMKWAARDNDRTMLFGAEIAVKPGQ